MSPRKSSHEIAPASEGDVCPLSPKTPNEIWKRMCELAREIVERSPDDDAYDIDFLEVTADLGRELAELTTELGGQPAEVLGPWMADYKPLAEPEPPAEPPPPKPFEPKALPAITELPTVFRTPVGKKCKKHKTHPEPDEPCWGCENDATDG